jgi:hypothetical protein
MSIIEKIKEHPKLVVAAVVGFVVLLYLYNRSGGSGGVSATGYNTDVSAATGLQAAQLAASSQNAQTSAAAGVAQSQIAAQEHIAELQAAQAGAHDQLAAQVATSNINATVQLQSLLASLGADVQKGQQNVQVAGINADVSKTGIMASSQIQQYQILADAMKSAYSSQASVAQAGYAAQVEISSHQGGLFGGGGFLGLGI